MRIFSVIDLRKKVLSWFKTYLQHCEFYVCIKENSSSPEMKNRIPRGTVLGPLLFFICTAEGMKGMVHLVIYLWLKEAENKLVSNHSALKTWMNFRKLKLFADRIGNKLIRSSNVIKNFKFYA